MCFLLMDLEKSAGRIIAIVTGLLYISGSVAFLFKDRASRKKEPEPSRYRKDRGSTLCLLDEEVECGQ